MLTLIAHNWCARQKLLLFFYFNSNSALSLIVVLCFLCYCLWLCFFLFLSISFSVILSPSFKHSVHQTSIHLRTLLPKANVHIHSACPPFLIFSPYNYFYYRLVTILFLLPVFHYSIWLAPVVCVCFLWRKKKKGVLIWRQTRLQNSLLLNAQHTRACTHKTLEDSI